MKRFDILDRDLNIHSNRLIEASAGTGKTFSIENLTLRLLLEREVPLTIDKILIVTFTRMATHDLKTRIRKNLERAIQRLEEKREEHFGYLQPYLESETQQILAKHRLERALVAFDDAQIFTIHGFCSRMLNECGFEGNVKVNIGDVDQTIHRERLLSCIRDYFRTGMGKVEVGAAHLSWALKECQGSLEKLEFTLLRILENGLDVEPISSYETLYRLFINSMMQLKSELGVTSEGVMHDFELLAPCYSGVCNRSRQIKQEVLEKIERFSRLFDHDQWSKSEYDQLVVDQLIWCQLFTQEKQLKRATLPDESTLKYPELVSRLKQSLAPTVHHRLGLGRMAYACQKLMRHQFLQEELLGYDDLLTLMQQGLKSPNFVQKIRERYRAVVVDEFQDTDPRQWEIFKHLFPPNEKNWGHLYLVGDPKQSIYAFRQADIYTYLEAAGMIGEDHIASLDTNYRSQPSLVKALNELFTTPFTEGWIPLPRNGSYLGVPKVKWREGATNRDFHDNRGAVHFFITEEKSYSLETFETEQFSPFIVQEIQRLHDEQDVSFKEFAILVADRFQAERVANFLKEWGIPTQRQRTETLATSIAVSSLREFLYAIVHYHDESAVKTALGGHFIRWTHDHVRQLENIEVYEKVQFQFQTLSHIWKQEGLSACLQTLIHSIWCEPSPQERGVSWKGFRTPPNLSELKYSPLKEGVSCNFDEKTVLENILEGEGGGQFYADFQQITEVLLEEERSQEGDIAYLDELSEKTWSEEEKLKRRADPNQEAVQILTLHASKGLEFGIVFTLGLVKRTRLPNMFYPSKKCLKLVKDPQEKDYQEYLQELDAEKMRQLYVAMTRAKYRLYNPVALIEKNAELGIRSPMEIFLSNFNVDFFQYLDESMGRESIAYTHLNKIPTILEKKCEIASVQLCKPKVVSVPGHPVFIHSFTSLSHKKGHQITDKPPHDFYVEDKTPRTLPSGSETGILLHKLLEDIPFHWGKQWNKPKDVCSHLHPYLENTEYMGWEEVIAEMIFHAVKTPLINGLCLESVDPNCCQYEAEFLFKIPSESYVKGFIDLMFFYDGKYYLLDWKSNWLGVKCEDYHKEKLKQAMNKYDYFLQAKIYTDALRRYLTITEKEPFEMLFGGVFYLFLRGLPDHGIIHFIPS